MDTSKRLSSTYAGTTTAVRPKSNIMKWSLLLIFLAIGISSVNIFSLTASISVSMNDSNDNWMMETMAEFTKKHVKVGPEKEDAEVQPEEEEAQDVQPEGKEVQEKRKKARRLKKRKKSRKPSKKRKKFKKAQPEEKEAEVKPEEEVQEAQREEKEAQEAQPEEKEATARGVTNTDMYEPVTSRKMNQIDASVGHKAEGGCTTTLDAEALTPKARRVLIFSAPKPLQESEPMPEILLKWDSLLKQQDQGRLVIFANDPVTRQTCQKHNILVACVPHTDEGLPRFDHMMQRMGQAGALVAHMNSMDTNPVNQNDGIVAYVNADIEIREAGIDPLCDFLKSLQGKDFQVLRPTQLDQPYHAPVNQTTKDWFAAMTRIDVSAISNKKQMETVHDMVGFDLWAWNVRADKDSDGRPSYSSSLLPMSLPPFRFPLAVYDSWLFSMVQQVAQRAVIDMSQVANIYHAKHKENSDSWFRRFKQGTTGVILNRYLGYTEPSNNLTLNSDDLHEKYSELRFYKGLGSTVEAPYVATRQEDSGLVVLHKRKYWRKFLNQKKSQQSSLENSAEDDHARQTKIEIDRIQTAMTRLLDGNETASQGRNDKYGELVNNAINKWRYTMQRQLELHATSDKLVMVTAVTYPYRSHLMNFMCNLEGVGMTNHFVVAALDKQMYEWGVLHGLPIFSVPGILSNNVDDHAYGGTTFKSVTKLKSRIVTKILEAGYSAIWSDVDITWFQHPFKALGQYISSNFTGIAIQSNAPLVENPEAKSQPHPSVRYNATQRVAAHGLNSGLYLAKSNRNVIAAFQEIVEHAMSMGDKSSEQPSFDHVLCDRKPSSRQESTCGFRRSNIRSKKKKHFFLVQTLDRKVFPNGAILVGPQNQNVYDLGREQFENYTGIELAIAHNNYIVGSRNKMERQLQRGWWFLEEGNDKLACVYPGDEGAFLVVDRVAGVSQKASEGGGTPRNKKEDIISEPVVDQGAAIPQEASTGRGRRKKKTEEQGDTKKKGGKRTKTKTEKGVFDMGAVPLEQEEEEAIVGLNCPIESTTRTLDDIQIHIIAWRRNEGLQRLLQQLEMADYTGWKHPNGVPLYIHIEGEPDAEVVQTAEGFQWTHGAKHVREQPTRVGLRSMWLDSLGTAAAQAGNNTLMVMFEDDIIVSPVYFQWLLRQIDHYAPSPRCRDSSLIGFSLSPLVYQEMFKPFNVWNATKEMQDKPARGRRGKGNKHKPSGPIDTAYLSAFPSSWGSAYWSDHWNDFNQFVRLRQQPPFFDEEAENVEVKDYSALKMSPTYLHIPNNARANVWPKSWKRFMIDFMYGRGLVMMFPNLRDGKGLASALLEDGERISNADGKLRTSELAQELDDAILPRQYSSMIVFGLDHKKADKVLLAVKGLEFLNRVARKCTHPSCNQLLQAWARPGLHITTAVNQDPPIVCAADLYTSVDTMRTRMVAESSSPSAAPTDRYLFFEPQYGTNNQIEATINAYLWAKLLGRRLVLPPLFPPRVSEYYNTSADSWINFLDFFELQGNSSQVFERNQFFEFEGRDADPISYEEFARLNLVPTRMLRLTQGAIFDKSSKLLATDLFGGGNGTKIIELPLETVDLRSAFLSTRTVDRVQHFLGGCDDTVLAFEAMFYAKLEPPELHPVNVLADLLTLSPNVKRMINTLKAKLVDELGSEDYTCYQVRQGDFSAMCDTLDNPDKNNGTTVPKAYYDLARKFLCYVTADDLSAAMLEDNRPALVLSDNAPGLQSALGKSPQKSLTSDWVSNMTAQVSQLRGNELRLLSLIADQELCAASKMAVLSRMSTVGRRILALRHHQDYRFWMKPGAAVE